jgi:hypothetical protein
VSGTVDEFTLIPAFKQCVDSGNYAAIFQKCTKLVEKIKDLTSEQQLSSNTAMARG